MAWDILPKANLQYFLTKLKNKFLMLTNYNKLGAKNILPFPYAYGSGTVHDLTVTVNDDGSITANGQPTQNVSFTLVSNIITEYGLQVGDKLIFSESNVENDNASAALVYVNPSGPIDLVQGDYELTITSDMVTKGVAFILWFHSGVDLSTAVTFKPMLRLDTDPDPTWASPAFTNRKLTELVVYLSRNKSHVVANPSTTTDILGSVTIDGTSYTIQGGGGAVTGVKGSYETDYRTGDVSVSAKNVGALAIVGNVTVSSLDDLTALCLNSGNQKAFQGPINISTDIGVGVTGWCNTLGVCLNTPGNGNNNISLFCLFMRTTGDAPKFAVINGASTGNYSVTYTGTLVKTTDLATVATSGSYNDLSNKPTIPAAVAVKGNEEQNYRTGNVNLTPDNIGAVPLKTSTGIGRVSGSGQYSWCRIATLKVTSTYCNGPIAFEVSQRQEAVCMIQVCFASANNTDPGLSYFITNGSSRYYIKKTTTSTWELYCNYTEAWGELALHRITGDKYNNGVSVTVDMVNISAPSGTTQVSNGGTASYANSAGSATVASQANNVYNGALTLQKNGTTLCTFFANQSSNSTFNVVNTITSFTTKTVSFNVSVGAYSDGVYRPTITNSGWTPLGVVGLYTGMTTLFALRYGLESSTTARIDLHNVHSAAVSGTASVTVLYYKNTDS